MNPELHNVEYADESAVSPDSCPSSVGRRASRPLTSAEARYLDKSPFTRTFVTRSARMIPVFKRLANTAPHNVPALILGKSGTGKELIARIIHEHGRHPSEAFLPINATELPLEGNVLEVELFGAAGDYFQLGRPEIKGIFERVGQGTLFLDEIGDAPMVLQSKLLRVLQEGTVQKLGVAHPLEIQCRMVFGTNKNLKELVRQGKFREDLYYRIQGGLVELLSLSNRIEDIPYLVSHFMGKFHALYRLGVKVADETGLSLLSTYPWPGNVRELENVLKDAYLQSPNSQVISCARLQEAIARVEIQPNTPQSSNGHEDRLNCFIAAFRATDSDISISERMTEASRKLQISKSAAYEMLRRQKLRPKCL